MEKLKINSENENSPSAPVKPQQSIPDYFPLAVRYAIQNEIGSDPKGNGGFTNHASDKGGATKWGVTRGTLGAWRGAEVSVSDVENLTRAEAEEIYRAFFWEVMKCPKIIRPQIAISMLDASVLFGVGRAGRFVQSALYANGFEITRDGIVGSRTLEALNAVSPRRFIERLQDVMGNFAAELAGADEGQLVFFEGWMNRIDRLKTLV